MSDSKLIIEKKHFLSIDVMKALAVLLIINHRIPLSYVDYPWLATGGAIGCSLFFYLSGFTLSKSQITSFADWVKNRAGRIYPTVWVALVLNYSLSNTTSVSLLDFVFASSFWFVECILIYYIVFYWILKYFYDKLPVLIILTLLVYFVVSFYNVDGNVSLYGQNRMKYILFFSVFLFGALCRRYNENISLRYIKTRKRVLIVKILLFLSLFYITYYIPSIFKNDYYSFIAQFVLFFALPIFVFYIFVLLQNLESRISSGVLYKHASVIIYLIASLSLECFVIQNIVTRDIEKALICLYPLNIPLVFIIVIAQAYFLRVITRFFFGLVGANYFSFSSIFSIVNKYKL